MSLMSIFDQQEPLRDSKQLSRKAVASAAVQFKRPAQRSPRANRPARHQLGPRGDLCLCAARGKATDMSWREAIVIDSISTETAAYPIAISVARGAIPAAADEASFDQHLETWASHSPWSPSSGFLGRRGQGSWVEKAHQHLHESKCTAVMCLCICGTGPIKTAREDTANGEFSVFHVLILLLPHPPSPSPAAPGSTDQPRSSAHDSDDPA